MKRKNELVVNTEINLNALIEEYPPEIRKRFQEFRNLVMQVLSEIESVSRLDINIKWGEPSFRSNIGSPFRFGWKPTNPNNFGIYFICTTTLVETFKQLYPGLFKFDENRGLIFNLNNTLPKEPLDHCLKLALTYKKVRNLPLLGA